MRLFSLVQVQIQSLNHSFAPKPRLYECLPCPVSFICPDFGMSKPLLCPAGKVCDQIGLISPSVSCPPGHFCNPGTKTISPLSFSNSNEWIIDTETGRVVQNQNGSLWKKTQRHHPATGLFQIGHEPIIEEVLAEQPFPCPLGYYCRAGVSTEISSFSNFSTPQPCYEGYFCPRGSSKPEGNGPCPTGFFCPTVSLAYKCPMGHYCPGVGNIRPLECYPGSYASEMGLGKCSICEIGHICPSLGLSYPTFCPAGFVCDTLGLSKPFKVCPAGNYCESGTATTDPHSLTLKGPISCPKGVYCLGGVAHNITIEWIPSQEEGKVAPQQCHEGYYCDKSSTSPEGSGPCFAGHFCPPGTSYPIQVPVGTFADADFRC